MAVDLEHRYSNEVERANSDSYNDFKLKKTFGYMAYTKYFSAVRVEPPDAFERHTFGHPQGSTTMHQ